MYLSKNQMLKKFTMAAFLSFMAGSSMASSHREAPNITSIPKVDATDFYIFNSYETGREAYVTMIANYNPLQDAYGGPNYFTMDSRALYEIHVDNDGDAKEDISFRFRFVNRLKDGQGITVNVGDKNLSIPLKHAAPISAGDDAGLGFNEKYIVQLVNGDRRRGRRQNVTNLSTGSRLFTKPYDNVGQKTFVDNIPDGQAYSRYAQQYIYDVNIPGCTHAGKVFVGQRKESFAVNLGETFDLVNNVPIEGDSVAGAGDGAGFPAGITQNKLNDDLGDKNITTIAMEIHKDCLIGNGNGVIGAWTSASLRQVSILNPRASFRLPKIVGGSWTQVSRLSNPLVNEVVIGIRDKDRFNSSHPKNDAKFADYVTHPTLPVLLNSLFLDAVNGLINPVTPTFTQLHPNNYPRADLVAAFLTGIKGVNQQSKSVENPAEMIRLNTAIAPTAAAQQKSLGVIDGDNAGFPNGRRPGDDVVDIALRVVMGKLCHLSLSLCVMENAPVGNQAFTDGAPISAQDFDESFPYLKSPIAGSPN